MRQSGPRPERGHVIGSAIRVRPALAVPGEQAVKSEQRDRAENRRPEQPSVGTLGRSRKTAPAFEVALRLGAVYAGAGQDVGDVLARYSSALGIAYQIRDDVEDLDEGAHAPEQ